MGLYQEVKENNQKLQENSWTLLSKNSKFWPMTRHLDLCWTDLSKMVISHSYELEMMRGLLRWKLDSWGFLWIGNNRSSSLYFRRYERLKLTYSSKHYEKNKSKGVLNLTFVL